MRASDQLFQWQVDDVKSTFVHPINTAIDECSPNGPIPLVASAAFKASNNEMNLVSPPTNDFRLAWHLRLKTEKVTQISDVWNVFFGVLS